MTQRILLTTCPIGTLLVALVTIPGCLLTGDPQEAHGDAQALEDADETPNDACAPWQVGTMTGYNNSNLADDPNAGSVMEFTGLTDAFYDNVPIAAIDSSDWDRDKYHWIDINYGGTVRRVGAWDACRNQDCPDGTNCCTENKQRYALPGYLLDLETRTAKRLFGVTNAEETLNDRIEYRTCSAFDPDEIAAQYGVHR